MASPSNTASRLSGLKRKADHDDVGHEKRGKTQGADMLAHADATKKKVATIADLPSDTMLRIFSYLKKDDLMLRVACVCKGWQKLATNPVLWKSVKLSGRYMTGRKAIYLVRGMTQLRNLELTDWWGERVDDILDMVRSSAPGLEVLHLYRMNALRDSALEMFMQACSNLKEVYFVSVLGSRRHPLDVMLSLPQLERFCLTGDTEARPPDASLERNWPKLREVTFWRMFSGSSDEEFQVVVNSIGDHLHILTVKELREPQSYALLEKCQHLHELKLECTDGLTDDAFLSGIGSLTHLQNLTLRKGNITSNALQLYFSRRESVHNLRNIDLSFTPSLTDQHLSTMSMNCCHLKSLSLRGCRNFTLEGLLRIVDHTRSLERLELKWCYQLGDIGHVFWEIRAIRPQMEVGFYN